MSSSRELWVPIFSQLGIMRNEVLRMSESEFQEKCQFCRECGFDCPDDELAKAIEESLMEQKKPTIVKPVIQGSKNSARGPSSARHEKTVSPRGASSHSSSAAKPAPHVRPSQNKPLASISDKQDVKKSHHSSKEGEKTDAKPKDTRESSSRHRDNIEPITKQKEVKESSSRHKEVRESSSKHKEVKEASSKPKEARESSSRSKDTKESSSRHRDEIRESSSRKGTRESSSRNKDSGEPKVDNRESSSKHKHGERSHSSSKHSEEIPVKPPVSSSSHKNPREQSQSQPKKPAEQKETQQQNQSSQNAKEVSIGFSFPDGNRIIKKFALNTKGSNLNKFVASQPQMVSSKGAPIKFSLQQTLGPQLKPDSSLESQGITKNTMFIVVFDDDQEL